MWMSNSAVVCQEFKYLIWWYTILDHSLASSLMCFAQRKHSFQALIPHTEKNLASSTDIEMTYNQVFYTEECPVLVLSIRPLTRKTLPIPVVFVLKLYTPVFPLPEKWSAQILTHCRIPLQVFYDFQGWIVKHRNMGVQPASLGDEKVMVVLYLDHCKCSVKKTSSEWCN